MQTELIQLLQHEDYNNVKLGIYIAIANGHNAVEIVDNMLWDGADAMDNSFITLRYNNIQFRMLVEQVSFLYFFTRTRYTLKIWDFKYDDYYPNDKEIEVYSEKKYNKTYTKYAQHFIDLILQTD